MWPPMAVGAFFPHREWRRLPGVLPKRPFSESKLAGGNSRHNRYGQPKPGLGCRPAKVIPWPPHNTRKHTIRPTPLRILPSSAAPPWATAALTGPVTWWRSRIRKFCTAAINQLWIFCRHTPPPPGLLGPVMVDGIGKAALHNVLPALAAVARCWTVGLRTGRGHQRRLHLPSNRPSPLGLGALLPQRTVGAGGGILHRTDRELLLGPVLMAH